jgi:hypothetical protein
MNNKFEGVVSVTTCPVSGMAVTLAKDPHKFKWVVLTVQNTENRYTAVGS